MRPGGPSPLDLQYVEIPIVDREICANAYRLVNDVNENMICAGLYGVGGRDACKCTFEIRSSTMIQIKLF